MRTQRKRLQNRHKQIYDVIKRHPNNTILFYHEEAKMPFHSAQRCLTLLINSGLVIRTGRSGRLHKYTATDKDYDEVKSTFVQEYKERKIEIDKSTEDLHDPLLDKAITFELTDDQWNYIKANPTLSRSMVAKKLGIQKVVLNAAIARRKDREGMKA